MIKINFYNSKNKKVELFNHDIQKTINIYSCGPTVYNSVHLDNLKTFLWSDFIVGYLNLIGYKTNHIMNITNIDDKIIKNIPEQTLECLITYTEYYTEKFLIDLKKIGIRYYTKENLYKVTDNLDTIELMIDKLLENNNAYKVNDGSIYFDSSKVKKYPFPDVKINNDFQYISIRNIIRSRGVKSQNDFALWKIKKNNEIKFNSKFGAGRPGWHIECSAICENILGKVHIHIGGEDLKFPHHTCEILQSEFYYSGTCNTGYCNSEYCNMEYCNSHKIFGDYWIHIGFLNFNGDKMSKSIGNVIKLDDVNINYKLLRMYFLTKSYRKSFEYNEEEIIKLKKHFINLHLLYNKLKYKFYVTNSIDKLNCNNDDEDIYNQIINVISWDFDSNSGLKILYKYVDKYMKVYLTNEIAEQILTNIIKINNIFNILDMNLLNLEEETLNFIKKREEYRKVNNFFESDKIRKELKEKFIYEDEKTGYTLIKKF